MPSKILESIYNVFSEKECNDLYLPKRKMRRFLWKHQTCNASRDKISIKIKNFS